MKLKYGPYSPSRLDVAVCPFYFHGAYIEKTIKEPENLPQARGSVLHEVLESVTARLCKDPNAFFKPEEIRELVKNSCLKHRAALEEVGPIMEWVRMYIDRPPVGLEPDAEIEKLLALKYDGKEFHECDYWDPGAWVRGRADILMLSEDTTKGVIIDHKTQPNIEPADTPQMGFYAWVLMTMYPFLEEVHTVLHFARYGSYSEPHVWTRDDLRLKQDEILTQISIVEGTEDWTQAIPNGKCNYCPRKLECPSVMGREVYQTDDGHYRVSKTTFNTHGDTDKAVELAGLINVCEEILSNAKAALKKHVKDSGPIAIPGRVYEFRAKEDVNWSKLNTNQKAREAVMEVFHKHGVDPKTFMAFSSTVSKSVWLSDKPEMVKELSDVIPRKTSTKFEGYKI